MTLDASARLGASAREGAASPVSDAGHEDGSEDGSKDGSKDGSIVWTEVCALDDIIPDTGVCALLGGRQVAVVRVGDGAEGDKVYAIDNFDPFSRAFVLARGIVGDKNGTPKISSPIFKQGFELSTGQCLDNPKVRVPVYLVRVRGGRVELGARLAAAPGATRAPGPGAEQA